MIIPYINLKGNKVVNVCCKEVGEVEDFMNILRICPNVFVKLCDSSEVAKESLKKILKVFSCSVCSAFTKMEDVLQLLNNASQTAVVNHDNNEILSGFPENLKNRVMISVEVNSIDEESMPQLSPIIKKIKEQNFSTVLLSLAQSSRKPGELKKFAQGLIQMVGKDVKIIFSLTQDDAPNLSEIVEMHNLNIDVGINASSIGKGVDLGDIIGSCITSDRPDGLFQTIVVSFETIVASFECVIP